MLRFLFSGFAASCCQLRCKPPAFCLLLLLRLLQLPVSIHLSSVTLGGTEAAACECIYLGALR